MAKRSHKLALVLGGGGARGLAHIGVLKVLQKAGIIPDLIVGTSMGAVIGGMYAQLGDISSVENKVLSYIQSYGVKGRWLSFLGESESKNHKDFLHDISYFIKKRYVGLRTLTKISLEEKEVLYNPLKSFLREDLIENCRISFAAVSLDLRSGQPRVFDSGPIIEAVYASSAVEGVFPPLDHCGMILSDGGPVAMIPVEIARDMGAERIIAVDVSLDIKEESDYSSGLQVIFRADTIAQERLRMVDLSLADLVISPKIKAVHWASFSRINHCIRRGEIAARESLEKIKELARPKPWWKKIFSRTV